MLDTTALSLHSNKPSPRKKSTPTNKQKSKTKSIITPCYCSQGLKSVTGIQGKQRSFAYCTQNTGYGGLKSKNHFMDHIAGNILVLTDRLPVYSFSMCCALVWELEEDGRLFSRCHFLSQCTWVIFKPLKKIFPGIDTGLYRKKTWKKLWFLPKKHMKGFEMRMTNTLFFHKTEKDPW